MSDFSHLAASLDGMGTGAEGGAYDPTVIRHLADRYVYVHPQHNTIQSNGKERHNSLLEAIRRAVSACQHNGQVAVSIGLAGHAATWSAMESLLPSLVNIANTEPNAEVSLSSSEDGAKTIPPPLPTQSVPVFNLNHNPSSALLTSSSSWELMFTIETASDILLDMLGNICCF